VEVAGRKVTAYSVALFGVFLVGAFLRLYHLGTQSIWWDEAFSVWISKQSLSQIVQTTATDVHPPLYYFILHYWIALFGTSEVAVRSLSVLFGVLAVPMIYAVGRQLFNEEAGLLSALILALSSFNIWYSQETRMYTLMVLLALLSMYFFTRFLQKTTVAVSVGYFISTTLLLYTHVYGAFVVIAQNVYLLTLLVFWREREFRLKYWIMLQALLVVFFAPWIGVLISQILRRARWVAIAPPTLHTVLDVFVRYAGMDVLLVLFIGLSLFSLFEHQKFRGAMDWKVPLKALQSYAWEVRIANVEPVYFLAVWLFTINIIPFVISWLTQPIYQDLYTIAASVALYLLVAKGISNINHRYSKLAVIAIVVALLAAPLQTGYTTIIKAQGREATSFIDANAKSGDVVLITPGGHSLLFDYYNNRTDLAVKPIKYWETTQSSNRSDDKVKEIQSYVNGRERVWLFNVTRERSNAADDFTFKILNVSYANTEVMSYHGYVVYLFEKRA